MTTFEKLNEVSFLIPPLQLRALKEHLEGEEKSYFEEVVDEMHEKLKRMRNEEPDTFFFHYFSGYGDWWMMEVNERSGVAYGYVRLGMAPECAEFGTFALDEIFACDRLLNVEYAEALPVEKILKKYNYAS